MFKFDDEEEIGIPSSLLRTKDAPSWSTPGGTFPYTILQAVQAHIRVEPPKGSKERYKARLNKFEEDGATLPAIRHHAHWLFHNCVVHPLLGLFPNQMTVDLHGLSSHWLNRLKRSFVRLESLPTIPQRGWWVVHNCISHTAIGLLPIKITFKFHDWTAEKMKVPEWV